MFSSVMYNEFLMNYSYQALLSIRIIFIFKMLLKLALIYAKFDVDQLNRMNFYSVQTLFGNYIIYTYSSSVSKYK